MRASKHWDCQWTIDEIFKSNGGKVYIDRCYKTTGYSRSIEGYALYCDISKLIEKDDDYKYLAITITDDGWYTGCTYKEIKSVGNVDVSGYFEAVPMEKESLTEAITEITFWKNWLDKRTEKIRNYNDNSFDYMEEVERTMMYTNKK